jgi:23S rRNA (adenine2503-C2)-methyltransferase
MELFRVLERDRTLGTFDTPEQVVFPGSVEKFVLELDDGNAVEAILIGSFGPRVNAALKLDRAIERRFGVSLAARWSRLQRKIRYETCVSTQVGCALDCQFCASSLVPFDRNLSFEEMQREILTLESRLPTGAVLKKVVFAGVGEPLMNYANVAATVRWLKTRGIASRINTVGVLPYLEKMFEERLPVELIVSFHAPNDLLRTQLMPVGKGYPLVDLCEVLSRAPEGMLVEAKYLMLRDLNDSIDHADQLASLIGELPLMVTLQIYNRISEFNFEPSRPEQVRSFAAHLRARGLKVGILNSNIGEPVDGGCGQLRARVVKKSRLPVLG